MSEELLSVKQACALLHIHPLTLRNWDKKGKIKIVRTKNGRKVPKSEVDRLLREDLFVIQKSKGVPPGIYNRIVVTLSVPEYEEMKIIKDFLFKNGVVTSSAEDVFVRYCIRHVMEEFKAVLQGGLEAIELKK